MRRFRILEATLLLIAILLAGLVWLTHHPDSESVLQATHLPLVGPWLEQLQRIYLPPPAAPRENPREETDDLARILPREPPRKHIEVNLEAIQAYPFEWFVSGTHVYELPDPGSKVLFTLDNPARFGLRERKGRWARIRTAIQDGWIRVDASTVSSAPPLGIEPTPVTAVDGRAPEEQRLARALEVLGPDSRSLAMGPYEGFTDLEDEDLLRHLDRAAKHHEASYSQRYRLPLEGEPKAVIVLFSKAADYRRFQADDARLNDLRASGHAGYGIVALFAEGSSREELVGTLLHELSHLTSRRAVGPALPPWLDEGLAEDFAGLAVGADGSVREGTWRGEKSASFGSIRWTGTLVDLIQIERQRSLGQLISLTELLALPWESFVRAEEPRLRYAHSALWIRFLLRPEGQLATPFRSFLRAVAAGEQPTAENLRAHLDQDWVSLEQGFRMWIQEQAALRT